MTRQELLAVLAAVAGVSIAGSAQAAVTDRDLSALEQAAQEGTTEVQAFLHHNLESPLAGEAVRKLFQLAEVGKAQGFERSGNPRAAGGPDNPGVGNPHTPDC